MNTKTIGSFLLFVTLTWVAGGCYYDNEEELYPGSSNCDTSNITYSTKVAPIFSGYCNSCHGSGSPAGGLATDNYASVKTNITAIRGAINHTPGFLSMPQNGGKLPACDLSKIDIWIRQGMLNN